MPAKNSFSEEPRFRAADRDKVLKEAREEGGNIIDISKHQQENSLLNQARVEALMSYSLSEARIRLPKIRDKAIQSFINARESLDNDSFHSCIAEWESLFNIIQGVLKELKIDWGDVSINAEEIDRYIDEAKRSRSKTGTHG